MHRRIRGTEEQARSTDDTKRTRTHGQASEERAARTRRTATAERPRERKKSRGRAAGSRFSVCPRFNNYSHCPGGVGVQGLTKSQAYPLEKSQAHVVPRNPPGPRAPKRHPGSRGPRGGTGPPTPPPPTRDCPSIAEKTDCVYLPFKQMRNSIKPGDTYTHITHIFTHTITHKVPR